jgi:hypothetical protein
VTRGDAERIVAGWTRRLLPEWRVVLEWDADGEMTIEGAQLEVQPTRDYPYARILIPSRWLDARDADAARRFGPDASDDDEREGDLVHELCHLIVRETRRVHGRTSALLGHEGERLADEAYSSAEERVVERLATALVALERRAAS